MRVPSAGENLLIHINKFLLTAALALLALLAGPNPAALGQQVRPSAGASASVILPPASPGVIAYTRSRYALYFVGTAWTLLCLGLIVKLKVGRRLTDRIDRWLPPRTPRLLRPLLRAALFYAGYSLIMLAWGLPVGLTSYGIERSYGFASYGLGLWALDRLRGYLFGLMTITTVWIGYLLLARSPRRWWLWLWAISVPCTVAATAIAPAVVDAAYNRFQPLPPGDLRRHIQQLADRAGIGDAKIYRVDSSRRTTKLNAYVTGIGPTKRIVIWDNTIRELPEDQVLSIVGHEIGHYVLRHIWVNVAVNILGGFIFLGLLSRLLPWVFARFGESAGLHRVDDLAGLPLVMMVIYLMLFLQTPFESAITRIEERQADRFGLNLTRNPEAAARAFVSLGKYNFDDPDPPRFIYYWFYSHPSLKERVEDALAFTP